MDLTLGSAFGLPSFLVPGILGVLLGATGVRLHRKDGTLPARTKASWVGMALILLGCICCLAYAPFVGLASMVLRP